MDLAFAGLILDAALNMQNSQKNHEQNRFQVSYFDGLGNQTMPDYLQHPAMDDFREALSRDLFRLILVGNICLATGMALLTLLFNRHWLWPLTGLFLVACGLYLLIRWSRSGSPEQTALYKVLCHRPGEIVWVYPVVTQVMPFGISLYDRSYLIFKLLNGREHALQVPSRKVRLLMKWLNRYLPHATFGYSANKARNYSADPARLIRRTSR